MRGLPRLGWLVVLGRVAAACAPAGKEPPVPTPATPPGVEASLLADHSDTDVLAIPGTDVDTPPELVVMGG